MTRITGIFLAFLCIKAVHNLKTKSLRISLRPWTVFAPIAAFQLFLVSEVEGGEECPHFRPILDFFGHN